MNSEKQSDDYDVNIRILALATSSIVFILVAIFCVRIYINQKQDIIRAMHLEGEMLETFCAENMNHTWYVIHLLAAQIKKNPHDVGYIRSIFKDYIGDSDVRDIFGWTEFMWFDTFLNTKVFSAKNHIASTSILNIPPKFSDRISYTVDNEHKTIHAMLGVKDNSTQEFIGAVFVNFDLNQIVSRIKARRKHEYTNIALIGDNAKVVIQSSDQMQNAGLNDGLITASNLSDAIAKIGFAQNSYKALTYLDMLTGQNFYVKKIKGLPFILLVNVDDIEIKRNLYHSVAMKFLEVSMIAVCFLLIIIFIYRRETWLRKKAELALDIATRATNTKSDFLAFTAHEIRSPLGFILTGSEMMKKELLGPMSRNYIEYVDGIHSNAHLILEFITDILDEAHILDGNFKVVNNRANIKEIIHNSISINQTKCSKKNLAIDLDIEEGLPDLICDARRILQVINNLLSNAAQYSHDNTAIRIIAKISDDKLSVEIEDQGVGMTEAEVAIAFAKYGTIRKKEFNFIESYGLGLSIVKMLLDAHNAELIVTTQAGIGSSFKIIFPQERTSHEA